MKDEAKVTRLLTCSPPCSDEGLSPASNRLRQPWQIRKVYESGLDVEVLRVIVVCRACSSVVILVQPVAQAKKRVEGNEHFTTSAQTAPPTVRNDYDPQTSPQSMGSSAMAVHMQPAAANTFGHFSHDLGDFTEQPRSTSDQQQAISDMVRVDYAPTQHAEPSNVRGGEEGEAGDARGEVEAHPDLPTFELATHPSMDDSLTDTLPTYATSEMSLNPEEMKGYAQLVFPDGEYLVTSTEIMLGRDERAQQILKEQERQQRREKREQAIRQARLRATEFDAKQDTLDPSHASAQADDESDQLEGRPAPGLPSTFSETGGIVNYEGSVDGVRRKRSKRRNMFLSRSSSTNSVAPASLHVYGAAVSPWNASEDNKCIFLPIHPFQAEDIRKISKEHLRIFYDGIEKHWKMEIKGNGAFVLNELYQERAKDHESGVEEVAPRHFKRGDTIILTHNTEVLVTSLTFIFKLPHRRGMSTFDSDDNSDNAALDVSQDSSDDSDSDDNKQKQTQTKRPKITLKATRPTVIEELADVPTGYGGKGGKKKPNEPAKDDSTTAPSETQPAAPPVFDANSTLQHVPVNELPEKRKGPGRPPKNGLVSKRDEGIIRRKMKEYEKRGERPPPYKDILAVVRAENRAKELAAKAAARGEPIPPNTDVVDALPTTEDDRATDTLAQPLTSTTANAVDSIEITDDTIQEHDTSELKAQQPQRTYRSPSPMKPKEEYTEEQLKRPTQTYYYILDEILSEDPEDAMELQQIYDKICKKYPFYKYVVESTGWQSSVRHNLKQNERFKPVSKQGKGWLWAIDPTIPLDKEKKKKPTPPPMSRPMHYDQNGLVQPGVPYDYMQYGQSAYHQQNAQLQQNGHQMYRSPYTQGPNMSQNAPPPHQPASNGQTHAQPQHANAQHNAVSRTVSQPTSRPTSNTPQPSTAQPAPLPPAFQDLVEEIMGFRVKYLSGFAGDATAYAHHERIFKRCVEWISQLHLRQNPEVKFENEEEKRVFQILEKMRHKFEQGSTSTQAGTTQPAQSHPQSYQSGQPQAQSQSESQSQYPLQPPQTVQQQTSTPQISAELHEPTATAPVGQDLAAVSGSIADATAAQPKSIEQTTDSDEAAVLSLTSEAAEPPAASSAESQLDQQPVSAGVKRAAEDELSADDNGEKRLKLEAS